MSVNDSAAVPAGPPPEVVDAVQRYLTRHALGRGQGKTRVEVVAGVRELGFRITERDLRHAIRSIMHAGFPACTSSTSGHYYANDDDDVQQAITMRRHMADDLLRECDELAKAWQKERDRRAASPGQSRLF